MDRSRLASRRRAWPTLRRISHASSATSGGRQRRREDQQRPAALMAPLAPIVVKAPRSPGGRNPLTARRCGSGAWCARSPSRAPGTLPAQPKSAGDCSPTVLWVAPIPLSARRYWRTVLS